MDDPNQLYENLEYELGKRNLKNIEIPKHILENLKFEPFEWNKNALRYFLAYSNPANNFQNHPVHLMFNMATGTGKTLLMASTILHYYAMGYRHFLFFVNQNNIVDKTENNFLDSGHSKYLYAKKIVIDNTDVSIKKVDTFSENPKDIEIKFTTIQKLYNDIHLERENQTTLGDLRTKNIVMLADEAHHLNTDTTRLNSQEMLDMHTELKVSSNQNIIEKKGWEHTVIELILNKNGNKINNKNVLLEFTATIPANETIAAKYSDKIIYKFGLKEFLQAGYTKNINLVSSNLGKKERIIQALVFSWYRHKIALKYDIPNFKPVVLFRSKTIEESKEDYDDFLNITSSLTTDDLEFLKNIERLRASEQLQLYEMGRTYTVKLLNFIKKEGIHYGEIVNFIKSNFTDRSTIITNSKSNKTKTEKTTDDQERLLNNLEDKDNHVRAIFTVQRLNEGWDVLNLFDIVRLYEGRDEGRDRLGARVAGSSTVAEKQLIGRGVRYYPFKYEDKLENKRKFDDEIDHELRILEELFFYSTSDHRYIDELKRELKRDGYISDERVRRTFAIKEEFKAIDYYKNVKIWKNEKIDNPNRQKKSLNEIKNEFIAPYRVKSISIKENQINLSEEQVEFRHNQLETGLQPNFSIKFKNIDKHIVSKAINIKAGNNDSVFKFRNIKKELIILSIDDLYNTNILGDFDVTAILNKNECYDDIPQKEKLNIVLNFLAGIEKEIKDSIAQFIGTPEFKPHSFDNIFGNPKTKVIDPLNENNSIVTDNDWYILDGFVGTSEELALVEAVKNTMTSLVEKYDEVYLLRNEEVYKIYDFEKGRGFAPDFIIFLKSKLKSNMYYQVFIEPKGNQFLNDKSTFIGGKEGWKEKFLESITEKFGTDNVIKSESKDYILYGLPLFNVENNENFNSKYTEIILEKNNA